MKILVTGAEGFIGKHFCRCAKKEGHEIIGLDKKNGHDILKCLPDKSRQLKDVQIILHLAANCSTSRSIADPEADFLDNALGTLKVLELAKLLQIPIVYTSTCKVYAANAVNALQGKEVHEEVSLVSGPRAPYGTSKLIGELYIQEYAEIYGIKSVVNRLSSIYGPDQDGSEEAGWLYWFVKAKKQNLPITLYGNGEQIRDCLWVEDFCRLLLEQLTDFPKFSGKIFNVGGGKENAISLNQVLYTLNQKGLPPLGIKHAAKRPADLNVYISDMTRLFSITSWRPTTPVKIGIDLLYGFI